MVVCCSIEFRKVWPEKQCTFRATPEHSRVDRSGLTNPLKWGSENRLKSRSEEEITALQQRHADLLLARGLRHGSDGRPERRAWWDTREGPGSDSIIGESIPLPGALGGDPITTSGLIYDVEGNHQFLEGNDGTKPWRRMQRKLNGVLDRIAAKADDSGSAVQVEVMGMGESSDADFPAIYADLFGERTFDNRKGGWSYQYLTSYGLPEFGG